MLPAKKIALYSERASTSLPPGPTVGRNRHAVAELREEAPRVYARDDVLVLRRRHRRRLLRREDRGVHLDLVDPLVAAAAAVANLERVVAERPLHRQAIEAALWDSVSSAELV